MNPIDILQPGTEINARIREISTHRPGRIGSRVAGGAIVTLLLVCGMTQAQQPSPPAHETKTVKEVAPAAPAAEAGRAAILKKLSSITIPNVAFQDVTVAEAIDFLRGRSSELDDNEPDPGKKGVNFVILDPSPAPAGAAADQRISGLNLKNVPLGTVLKYICDLTNLRHTVDDTAVTLSPKKDAGVEPALPVNGPAQEAIQNKLKSIIIPRLDFEDATIAEAIDFLRQRAAELDVTEPEPSKKGVNFVIRNPQPAAAGAAAAPRINQLVLANVPLGTALQYICEQTNLRYTVDDAAVMISPNKTD